MPLFYSINYLYIDWYFYLISIFVSRVFTKYCFIQLTNYEPQQKSYPNYNLNLNYMNTYPKLVLPELLILRKLYVTNMKLFCHFNPITPVMYISNPALNNNNMWVENLLKQLYKHEGGGLYYTQTIPQTPILLNYTFWVNLKIQTSVRNLITFK